MILAALALTMSLAAAPSNPDTVNAPESGAISPTFNIATERAETARILFHSCLATTLRDAAQIGPQAALDLAKSYCRELGKDFQTALRPVAAAASRKEGVVNRPSEAVLDYMAEEMIAMDMRDFEAALALKSSGG